MEVVVAGLPILVLLALLLLRRRPAVAVTAAIVVAVASAGMFPIDPRAAASAAASMGSVSLTVAAIMFAGLALVHLQRVSGAQDALSGWVNRVAGSRDRAVLVFGLALVPLFESLIGWGMGVIVVLPLLVGTGIQRHRAISISLLGLMLCPWGSFAPALLLLSEVTGIGLAEVGTATAWCSVVVIGVLGVAIALVGGGLAQLRRSGVELLCTWAAMSAALVVVNALLAPPLGGALSALAGLAVLIGFARLGRGRSGFGGFGGRGGRCVRGRGDGREVRQGHPRGADAAAVSSGQGIAMPALARRGLVPYAVVLIGLGCGVLVVRLAPPASASVGAAELLANPALWLLLALAVAPSALGVPARAALRGLGESFRVFVPAVCVTLLYIGFGVLIGVNGMGAALAAGATSLGGAFVALVPLAGFASGFVTSSNTASVAMLGEPLRAAAAGLGLDPAAVVGLHTAATGAGIMTNPSRAVLAIETAKLLPGAPEGTGPGGEHRSECRVGLGRVLAPTLWANAAIVALLTAISPFLFG